MKLANRIRKIREERKLTQEDVAFRCHISASAYGQIERNAENSKYRTLVKIANALGVSLNFLLDVETKNLKE
jgi:transcriptional regulator with XRE-family HTH domain